MNKVAPYAKALIGAIVAGLASLQQALDDGVVNAQEGTGVGIAFLSGLALVWAIPNKDPEAAHQDESVQPPQFGVVSATVALLSVIAVVLVLMLLGVGLELRG